MRLLEDNGFVGIGTELPQQKLHIEDGNIFISKDESVMPGVINGSLIFGAVRSPTFTSCWGIEYLINNETSGLNFWRNAMINPTLFSSLFLSGNGFVGIGTTMPETMLDVSGLLKATGATIIGTLSANILNANSATIADTLSAGLLNIQKLNVDTVTTNVLISQSATIPTIKGNTHVTGTISTNALTSQSAYISDNAFVNGSLGIGTTLPHEKLQVVDGSILISKTTGSETTGSIIFDDCQINNLSCHGSYHIWGIQYHHSSGKNGLEFWNNAAGTQTKEGEEDDGTTKGITSALFLNNNNNVGIGTTTPQAKLDVDGSFKAQSAEIAGALTAHTITMEELTTNTITTNVLNANSAIIPTLTGNTNVTGTLSAANLATQGNVVLNEGAISSLSLGKAYSGNLGYGTSYIGFNAVRNNTNGNWTCSGDNANNGGSVIYGTVGGTINFASIPSTGGAAKTLTDAQIKQNVKMQLTADGKLRAKEVKVTLSGWSDFVFANDYKLLPLSDVEQYIKENNRLPDIPSAAEVEENGVELGSMQAKLLMKIEELTLYTIEQQKLIEDLQKQVKELQQTKGGQ